MFSTKNTIPKNSRKKRLPEGVDVVIPYDSNTFLNASVDKVLTPHIEAFILVFIAVFIFLQDFRSTLIPTIAVPVSIVGTFFFLNLFALILAICIVVDDAIAAVEEVSAELPGNYDTACPDSPGKNWPRATRPRLFRFWSSYLCTSCSVPNTRVVCYHFRYCYLYRSEY